MTDFFQPGHHPDADTLSAFAENALPLAERQQTLAHLATCPDCRQILALALPEAASQQAPQPNPFWSRLTQPIWRLAGASLALASIVIATFLLLRPHPQISTPATLPPVLSAANRPAALPRHAAPEPTPTPPPKARILPGLSSFAEGGGTASSSRRLQAPRARLEPQVPRPLAPAPASQLPRPLDTNRTESYVVPQSAAPRSAAAPVILGAATQPADAATTRPLGYAANAVVLGRAVAPAPPPVLKAAPTSLPGDRPILASAARGSLVVAINDQHNTFLSNDGGIHWQPVLISWAGHAASVHLQPLAAITGTITDASGTVIPGATVQAAARTTQTDAAGRFVLSDLPPGKIRLEASAPGFATLIQTQTINAGAPLVDDLHLQVGQVAQTVTVAAASAEVATDQIVAAPLSAKKARAIAPAPAAPRAAPLPQPPPSAQFEIVTDDGHHFVSSDGRTWLPLASRP
jgi:hypothetical protein